MHEITTEIEINASAERVWSILVDFAAYPDWNPFIHEISGVPLVGEKLKVFIQPPDGNGMSFQPEVLVAEPRQEFRWCGRLLMSALFQGQHYFRIEPLGTDKVRFIHGEEFSGLLVPFVKSMLDKNTKAGFETMNEALKAKAELTGE